MYSLISSSKKSNLIGQSADFIKTSYDEFRLEFGINIITASEKNLSNLKVSLGDLSLEEERLKMIIMANLTARHKTDALASIHEMGGLLSVRQRENQSDKKVENSHTAAIAGNNNIFFTIGLGNHKIPSFLEKTEGHIIELKLQSLFENSTIIDGLFVSTHLSSYREETTTRPIWMGDTFFQFTHDDVAKQKVYTYRSTDGRTEIYTVKMADEIFCGRAVLEGLALQFIQHLRRIGGTYQRHIHETVMSEESSEEKKVEILSVAMQYMMPGWIYPEGKLPGALPEVFNNCHIEIIPHQRKSSIVTFPYASANYLVRLAIDRNYSSLLCPTFSQKKEFAETQSAYLTDLCYEDGISGEPLIFAARKNNLEMVNILLALKTADRKDPSIMRMADPNGKFCEGIVKDLIYEVCYRGHYEVLEKLIVAGAKVTGYNGYHYLCITARYADEKYLEEASNRRKCFELLLHHGANFRSENLNVWTIRGKTPLMYFALRGDKDGVQLCIQHKADVNKTFQKKYISLLAGVGNINTPQNGYTALHFLMISKSKIYDGEEGAERRLEIARYLIENGADIDILADNGDTIYFLAKKNGHDNIIALLESPQGGITLAKNNDFDSHKKIVVVIVAGKDSKGEDVVLVGKKKNKEGNIQHRYFAPGGFMERIDKTPIDAGLRELKEETFLDLSAEVADKKISASILYTYEGIDTQLSGRTAHYTIHYVLLNIGYLLAAKEFGSRDDLHEVTTISLAHIKINELEAITQKYYVLNNERKKIPIRPSNACIFLHLRKADFSAVLSLQAEEELQRFSDAETLGPHRLVAAAAQGNLSEVSYLVQVFGLAADHGEYSYPQAIYEAASSGHFEIVKFLIEHGASLSTHSEAVHRLSESKFYTPRHNGVLSAAALGDNIDLFEYLFKLTVEQVGKLSDQNRLSLILKNAFSTAVFAGQIRIAEYILEHSLVQADDMDDSGWGFYPLTIAAQSGKIEMVDFLLKRGANVNAVCSHTISYAKTYQVSPIMAAIEKEHNDIAKLLMSLPQTDINAHWTAANQKYVTVRNPLFQAVDCHNESLVKWILNNTAIDLEARNQNNETVLDFSMHYQKYSSALMIMLYVIAMAFCRKFEIKANALELEVGLDENNKLTVHSVIKDKQIATKIANEFRAALWEDVNTQAYVLRFGEIRLKRLMGSSESYQYISKLYNHDPTLLAPQRNLEQMDPEKGKNIAIKSTLVSSIADEPFPPSLINSSSFFNPPKEEKNSPSSNIRCILQ